MSDRREEALHPSGKVNPGPPSVPPPTADRERVVLLEFRLEQLSSQLQGARAEADRARTRLADAAAREADHAHRAANLHQELADARSDVAALHQRLERSEALRAEIEGYLFESGARADARELIRLRRDLFDERHRSTLRERELTQLRERVEGLLGSRELLLSRVAEWQQLVREDGPEAADLAEYMSELQREILHLEDRTAEGAAREASLRERLAIAGFDPDSEPSESEGLAGLRAPPVPEPERRPAAGPDLQASVTSPYGFAPKGPTPEEPTPEEPTPDALTPEDLTPERPTPDALTQHEPAQDEPAQEGPRPAQPLLDDPVEPLSPPATSTPWSSTPGRSGADALIAALASADLPALRSELLLRIGRTGGRELREAVRPWIRSPEARVRAAAFEALGRLLERDPDALEPDLRAGLSDADPRVRRRVVLAAATARGLPLRRLLSPLREDPDPQVRRVVREVLRHAPPIPMDTESRPDANAGNLAASGTAP